MMHDAGCEVTGIDICQSALDVAEQHYAGPTYVKEDINSDVWAIWPFDSVVSFETLEHLPDAVKTLRQMANCLKTGGTLICSVPNEERYPFKAENFANDEYPHLRHYTPAEFDALLDAAGFEVTERNCQKTKYSEVEPGTDGVFLVYVCRRR